MENENNTEYITYDNAAAFLELFRKNLKSYKEKDASVSDREWLEQLLREELPESEAEQAKRDAEVIVETIVVYDNDLKEVNESAKNGISKEKWLADKIQKASEGVAVNEFGASLKDIDDMLYAKNIELADALSRSSDGNISMCPNLDGYIAENYIAKTAQLSADIQNKNVRVDVRNAHTANSVDVRITDLDSGKYQNYQLKFGKTAQDTINLIENGNYNNQRLIVPSEQLEEVQTYFKAKGSEKTVTDHIEAYGVKGKSFTKEEMKALQESAQKSGMAPEMDYSHYQTRDLALNIGKNAGTMALQSAAVTTGLIAAKKLFEGEPVEADELVETAIKTGADTTVKTVAAGTFQVAVRKGVFKAIPKTLSTNAVTAIACVAVENVKVISKVASGELSLAKGIDQMGRTTVSMVSGLYAASVGASAGAAVGTAVGATIGAAIGAACGPYAAAIGGFIGGVVAYSAGAAIGDAVYTAGKAIASAAKTVARSVVCGIKAIGEAVVDTVRAVGGAILDLFGF